MGLGGKIPYLLIAVAILASFYFRCKCDQYAPVLQLNGGKVKGIVQKTEDGQEVYLYQGIAIAPVSCEVYIQLYTY